MRDIKFRGKNENNEWVYGTGIVQVEENTYDTERYEIVQKVNYDELDYFIPSYETEKVKPETIGQYTGLKDKNGVEIYEGDILEVNKHFEGDYEQPLSIGKVVFEDYGWFVGSKHHYEDLWELEHNIGFKILGNIYDNHELLEREEK